MRFSSSSIAERKACQLRELYTIGNRVHEAQHSVHVQYAANAKCTQNKRSARQDTPKRQQAIPNPPFVCTVIRIPAPLPTRTDTAAHSSTRSRNLPTTLLTRINSPINRNRNPKRNSNHNPHHHHSNKNPNPDPLPLTQSPPTFSDGGNTPTTPPRLPLLFGFGGLFREQSLPRRPHGVFFVVLDAAFGGERV